MHIKIFTLPFNSQLGVFDDEKFNDFVKEKELVAVNDYFFHRNEAPYLTLVIKYRQSSSVVETVFHKKTSDKNSEEWRKLLNDELIPLFNTLRQWRNEKSKKDDVSPYIILDNKQLAEICRMVEVFFCIYKRVVIALRLERRTLSLKGRCSNQLSYATISL